MIIKDGVHVIALKIKEHDCNPDPFYWDTPHGEKIASISMSTNRHRCFYKTIEFALGIKPEEIKKFTSIYFGSIVVGTQGLTGWGLLGRDGKTNGGALNLV